MYVMGVSTVEILSIVQMGSLAIAGGYFLYKRKYGYMLNNLTLRVSSARQRCQDGVKDHLVVNVVVIKGDRNGLRVHDIRTRIQYGDESVTVPLDGFTRTLMTTDKSTEMPRKTITWRPAKKIPYLTVAPGDEASFACHATVPLDCVAHVEVVVVGIRPKGKIYRQWRASTVSLPVVPRAVRN
jgi:hypothetical protein